MSLQHGKLMTKSLFKAYAWHKELLFTVSYNIGMGYLKCTQCVAVEESVQRDKIEELFATGLVNAKILYGFQDLREKIKEKSIGILLNKVTKHLKEERYFRDS